MISEARNANENRSLNIVLENKVEATAVNPGSGEMAGRFGAKRGGTG
jgi:hypothetical protein